MEERVRIARKALLEGVQPMTFKCEVRSCGGGACDDGYCDERGLTISRDEMMYVLNKRIGHNEVFENVAMMPFEVDDVLSDMAYEASWPNGGASIYLCDSIPDELTELTKRAECADPDDEEEYEELRSELMALEDGLYTFHFDVLDGSHDYCFAENEEYAVRLTAAQARGLIYGQVADAELFSGMKCVSLSEEDIEDKLYDLNVVENFDDISYSGSSDELDSYVAAWRTLIFNILQGKIVEDQLPEWLPYFSDFSENCDTEIEKWHSDSK
ncbi:MAG: hypothetical protein ACI4BH_09600 [Muribaculaceae bacterium]